MKLTRFDIAKKDIVSFFDNSEKKIFPFKQISEILKDNRNFWRLPTNLSTYKFIDLLSDKAKLKKHVFQFPSFEIGRYSWGEVPIFNLVFALKEKSYFSHYTAVFLNGLTDQIPKTIYLNSEQSKKSFGKNQLIQENINRAFKNAQRVSKTIAKYDNYNICLLNGKFTDQLGVVEWEYEENQKICLTNIERTLIDITVRPAYSGGVFQVLQAFKNAKEKVSINKLSAMLKKLDFVYPYHQAIGFYLDRSGSYKESQIKLLERYDIRYDFYLTHQMKDMAYSERWKIYHPKGL